MKQIKKYNSRDQQDKGWYSSYFIGLICCRATDTQQSLKKNDVLAAAILELWENLDEYRPAKISI